MRLVGALARLGRDRRGMTLVELVVLMVLLVFVLAAVYLYFDWGYGGCDRTLVDMKLVQDVRTALLQIDREARCAESPDEDIKAIQRLSDQILVIFCDQDNDEQPEVVRYYLESGVLYRQVIDDGGNTLQPLVRVLNTDIFKEQPADGSYQKRRIQVKLKVGSRATFTDTDRNYEVTAALPLRVE